MVSNPQRNKTNKIYTWMIAIIITLAAFYVLDHLVMSMQGLPLDWDLTPAQ